MRTEDVRLRHLAGRECLEAEALWREVFSEDTQLFTDYYFAHKAEKNRGLVLEGNEGIRAMLYLTPEAVAVGGQRVDSAYIVGVATKEKFRHRGYMAALLDETFRMLYAERMPFVFLMPASPDIYAPFQFTYIYEKPVWDCESMKRDRLIVLGDEDAERMVEFAQDFLEKEKNVYICRDSAYYKMQVLELAAQNGCIFGYEEPDLPGRLQGLCMYTQEEGTPEILEVLARAETEKKFVRRREETEPVIMARILHLPAMLELLRTKEGEADFVLAVRDPLIEKNNGRFLCRVNTAGAVITPCEDQPELEMTIEELTAILFGYRKAAEGSLSKVRLFSPVWINEIV